MVSADLHKQLQCGVRKRKETTTAEKQQYDFMDLVPNLYDRRHNSRVQILPGYPMPLPIQIDKLVNWSMS
jgi:hypothetical protein